MDANYKVMENRSWISRVAICGIMFALYFVLCCLLLLAYAAGMILPIPLSLFYCRDAESHIA